MGIQLYHIYEVFKYDNWQLKSTYSAVSLIFIYAHITHVFSLWGQPFYLLVYNEWVLLGSWIWTVNWTEFRQHISKFRTTQTLRTMRPSNSCLRMVSNYTCAGQFIWITCQEPGAVCRYEITSCNASVKVYKVLPTPKMWSKTWIYLSVKMKDIVQAFLVIRWEGPQSIHTVVVLTSTVALHYHSQW